MSTTGLGAEPPRKLRGRKRREWEAQAAQEAAAAAFSRLDAVQRDLRSRFAPAPEHAAAVDATAAAAFADLDAETDALSRRYLDTADRNPVAGRVGKPELLAASTVLRQAAFDLVSQAERLEAFAKAHPAP